MFQVFVYMLLLIISIISLRDLQSPKINEFDNLADAVDEAWDAVQFYLFVEDANLRSWGCQPGLPAAMAGARGAQTSGDRRIQDMLRDAPVLDINQRYSCAPVGNRLHSRHVARVGGLQQYPSLPS